MVSCVWTINAGAAAPAHRPRQNRPAHADPALEIAQRIAGFQTEPAIRLADLKTVPLQQLLKFQPLGAGQHPLVARPALRERTGAAQPVGQMADR